MAIEKTRLLACESLYWVHINANIEDMIKIFIPHALISRHNLRIKQCHMMPGIPWESVRADIGSINKKHYLCIVDYQSKFPVIKQVEDLSPDNLIKHVRLCSVVCSAQQNSFRCKHKLCIEEV